MNEGTIEGRNAVLGALRASKTVDKLYVQEGLKDGPTLSIMREVRKRGSHILCPDKKSLNRMSEGGEHQGVVAMIANHSYAELDDILTSTRKKGEDPLLILPDGIGDPHSLGAVIRTANQMGAHSVIINKNHAVRLTASVARTSTGMLNYMPVAKVANIARAIEEPKKEGSWFVVADMDGERMCSLNLRRPLGLVIGNEGKDVSELVRKKHDFVARILILGQADSLNTSIAAGVSAHEALRQRHS